MYAPQNPLIVQSDRSLLLEVDNSLYTAARDELARFAELEKSPEHIHTYRITPLSLWNAASAGMLALHYDRRGREPLFNQCIEGEGARPGEHESEPGKDVGEVGTEIEGVDVPGGR